MSQIQPLRVQKSASSSPQKDGISRHLSELSPSAGRRNSPSAQTIQKQLLDNSTFETSPFSSKFSPLNQKDSPHLYWQSRDSLSPTRGLENHDPYEESPVISKRASVERLKSASRVSKSNIFALEQKHEYDPMSSPKVERPLASSRLLASGMPLGLQARNSLLDHSKFFDKRRNQPTGQERARPLSPSRLQLEASEEQRKSPLSTAQSSPTKSAMSQNPRFSLFDPETSIWSEADDYEERTLPPGKGLHRHAKSVTFNQSPPEVQEYEQMTPDPSVSAHSRDGSYDDESDDESAQEQQARDGSQDSFDESLEDTDKTPVVLPEDWRHMSPEIANTSSTTNMEDPFGLHIANHELANANAAFNTRMSPARTDSMNSNGSRRPLPPLPPPTFPRERADSHDSLEAVAERAAFTKRDLPSPPRAAGISKDELRTIGTSSMTLEERLSLMSVQGEDAEQTPRRSQDETRERRMRRKSGLHNSVSEREIKIFEDASQEGEEEDQLGSVGEFQPIPRISRDSILRKVKSQKFDDYKSPEPESLGVTVIPQLNPDEPLRSYEESPSFVEGDDEVVIKEEEDDSLVDMYAVPEHISGDRETEPVNTLEDDSESQYSTDTTNGRKVSSQEELNGPPTPRAEKPTLGSENEQSGRKQGMSLPGFGTMLDDNFGLSFSSYMTPSQYSNMTGPQEVVDQSFDSELPAATSAEISESVPRAQTPELTRVPGYSDEELREPSTPDSVIRRSVSAESLEDIQSIIPEPAATIKAPGTKIKTRASLTPKDVRAMAETRRQVSGGNPPVPSIPQRHLHRPSAIAEAESFLEDPKTDDTDPTDYGAEKLTNRHSDLPQLDLSVNDEEAGELSFGLDKEFDRVIEAQKVAFEYLLAQTDLTNEDVLHHYVQAIDDLGLRGLRTDKLLRKQKGYLMRQNTKMVVASSRPNAMTSSDDASVPNKASSEVPGARETRSANNSPVKNSKHEISGAWQKHEWNGKTRRKSIRQSAGLPSELAMSGAVPPLPGMNSAVNEMECLDEADEPGVESPEGVERGRLFVRVVGVKDLNLPLPRTERSYFALTLDNGLHCVTTSWLELDKTAPIGQEFELVVLNDLEFQLTLQTKLEQPKPVARPDSPNKQPSPTKKQGFSRFFGSPKKKRELELKHEQERLAREREKTQARVQPTGWDLLHNLVAKDGSFARAYISLKEHEQEAFGRPFTVDVPCFNEWAMEEARTMNSTRSGKSTMTTNLLQRRAPYRVGKLELQLLFVPKPKDAKDEDMPKSMNACVREIQEAERLSTQSHEGYLSQQGGDCPYWRRRFFRLSGSRLTAYHESTHQPRATINLAKAIKLIDDKSNLKQQTTAKSGGRRKSAFGSEEDGYMFLEEGFRVRFANGETIDFYADNVALKDGWMQALVDVVGRDSRPSKGWTDIVLKREKTAKQAVLQRNDEYERRKASTEANARAHTASTASGGAVPGPRLSSRVDTGKRPSSSHGNSSSRPTQLKQGESMGPPAPPAKDRKAMDPAERRAKARSTYY